MSHENTLSFAEHLAIVQQMRSLSNFNFSMAGSTLEVMFYGPIGDEYEGISARVFVGELNRHARATEILIRMNSPGGNVIDGAAIYNALSRHKARKIIEVDGEATSAASYVAMAGDVIRIAANTPMMIHKPWSVTIGCDDDHFANGKVLQSMTNVYADTYASRTGNKHDDVVAMMTEETWMWGQEAVDKGFATELIASRKIAAFPIPYGWFKKTPQNLLMRPGAEVSSYRKKLEEKFGRPA